MGQTIAEALIEEGKALGALANKRETLARLVQLKFKWAPMVIVAEIEATQDSAQLDRWLNAFATAREIEDIPFQTKNFDPKLKVQLMNQALTEAFLEEGRTLGVLTSQRGMLIRLLRRKFKRVSPAIKAEIEATQDKEQLRCWLDAFATADKISDIPFQANSKK